MTNTTPPPRGCTNFKLRQLLRGVARHYDKELASCGLKGTQYSLLAHLVALGDIAPSTLAKRMGMDASTLTRNLRPLVEHGWVEQKAGRDARSRLIVLSAAGRALHAEAKLHWKQAQLGLNTMFGEREVAALHALIDHGLERLRGETP